MRQRLGIGWGSEHHATGYAIACEPDWHKLRLCYRTVPHSKSQYTLLWGSMFGCYSSPQVHSALSKRRFCFVIGPAILVDGHSGQSGSSQNAGIAGFGLVFHVPVHVHSQHGTNQEVIQGKWSKPGPPPQSPRSRSMWADGKVR